MLAIQTETDHLEAIRNAHNQPRIDGEAYYVSCEGEDGNGWNPKPATA